MRRPRSRPRVWSRLLCKPKTNGVRQPAPATTIRSSELARGTAPSAWRTKPKSPAIGTSVRRRVGAGSPASSPRLVPSTTSGALARTASSRASGSAGALHLVCSSFSEGYAASAPSVLQKYWAPATWLSGNYHGRTDTGEQTVTFKAHHAWVRTPSECPLRPGWRAFRHTSRGDSRSAAAGGWACRCAIAHRPRPESARSAPPAAPV